eukprot:16834-Heterococcus_DN1.PRE.3
MTRAVLVSLLALSVPSKTSSASTVAAENSKSCMLALAVQMQLHPSHWQLCVSYAVTYGCIHLANSARPLQ